MRTKSASSSNLRLFDALWSQVWILQLLKEWNIRETKPPTTGPECVVVVGLTMSIVYCLWKSVVCEAHSSAVPRVALACSGLGYLGLRGSSSNHVVLQCIVCLAVLEAALGNGCLRRSSRRLVGALYLITAIAKCNDGWVHREESCAVLYTVAAGAVLKMKDIPLLEILPYLALLGEFLLAFLFCFWDYVSSSSKTGLVVIGTVFHCGLALPMPPLSVYPFSALMAPLFALSDDRGPDEKDRAALAFGIFIFPLCLGIALRLAEEEKDLFEYPPYASWRHGLAWCLAAFAAVIYRAVTRPLTRFHDTTTKKCTPGIATAVLLLVGALPYLGLRTHPTFIMFSNLRLEGNRSNHWFFSNHILNRIAISDALSDVVTVTQAQHLPSILSMRVDLGQFIRDPHTLFTAANVSTEFVISPPAAHWLIDDDRLSQPFSTPRLEIRRRMSTVLKSKEPFLLEYIDHALPLSPYQRIERFDNGTLAADHPSLLQPLQPLVSAIFRFRVFDFDRAPCRH